MEHTEFKEQKEEQKVHREVRREHGSHSKSQKGGKATKALRQLYGASIVQIVLLVIIAFQLSNLGVVGTAGQAAGGDAPSAAAPSAPSAPPAPTVDMKAIVDDDAVKGNKDAPVTIVEFSDFECPFCARFYSQTLKQIESQYIKTGKVKLVFRDFPLGFHANAQKAAEAAECAGDQNKFWEMHDILFEKGVVGGVATFKKYAVDLGLNSASFNKCLDSGTHAAEVQKDLADGSAAGIQGTPGFVINGKVISGAQPFQVFQAAIEAELAQ